MPTFPHLGRAGEKQNTHTRVLRKDMRESLHDRARQLYMIDYY